MKLDKLRCSCNCFWVAPHAGAWIETIRRSFNNIWEAVAPHAGAWIETQK